MQNDDVLYHQWLETSRSDSTQLPEKQLLEAVLTQAFFDLQTITARRKKGWKKALQELRQWFVSNDMSHPFTFLSICHALEFDASAWHKRAAAYWTPKSRSVKVISENEWLEQLAACVPLEDCSK